MKQSGIWREWSDREGELPLPAGEGWGEGEVVQRQLPISRVQPRDLVVGSRQCVQNDPSQPISSRRSLHEVYPDENRGFASVGMYYWECSFLFDHFSLNLAFSRWEKE